MRALPWLLGLTAALATTGLAPAAAGADIYAGLSLSPQTVAPGDTFTVFIQIVAPDAEFNAFDASIRFDPAMLTFVPTSPLANQRGVVMTSACSNTFHRFTPTADSLKITLSLLCSNVYVTGPGPIYQVRFAAGPTPGITTLTLGPFTEFYRAGLFVRPLHAEPMVITIGSTNDVGPGDRARPGLELAPPAPNPRRGGAPLLLDFTLPSPDLVSFDLLDTQGRRVGGRPAVRFDAGRHRVSWSPPPLRSGDYFIRLSALENGTLARRWTVLK